MQSSLKLDFSRISSLHTSIRTWLMWRTRESTLRSTDSHDTMAAFTALCAPTSTATSTGVARTAWKRQGESVEAGARENGDMGQNSILEKTHEFFQMCDIENKGFISRRDMQVRMLLWLGFESCVTTDFYCIKVIEIKEMLQFMSA